MKIWMVLLLAAGVQSATLPVNHKLPGINHDCAAVAARTLFECWLMIINLHLVVFNISNEL
jgi:hypothetical protein